jgi:polyisoprenoid-binding protein YceI
MNLRSSIALGLFLIVIKITLAAPITLHIDNTHSSIQFDIPFMAISEVTGRFERFCGIFVFDEVNMAASQMELFIDASSINTGLKIRDRDLVEKYLETKTYPIIYFKSKSVRMTKPKQFEVIGDLRLHGVTKELHIILNTIGDIVNGDNARELGLKLDPLKLNRTDYGIMEGSMGSGSVGDTLTVSAIIRVRDVTPYRNGLDTRYPEKDAAITILFKGSFRGKSGAHINLINDAGNYFLAFSDDEWSWLAQAKVVGPNLFKLMSFGTLLELKPDAITFTPSGEQPEVLIREEIK